MARKVDIIDMAWQTFNHSTSHPLYQLALILLNTLWTECFRSIATVMKYTWCSTVMTYRYSWSQLPTCAGRVMSNQYRTELLTPPTLSRCPWDVCSPIQELRWNSPLILQQRPCSVLNERERIFLWLGLVNAKQHIEMRVTLKAHKKKLTQSWYSMPLIPLAAVVHKSMYSHQTLTCLFCCRDAIQNSAVRLTL